MKIVQFALPEELADKLEEAGLLAPAAIEAMLREQLRAVYTEKLGTILDRVAALPYEEPMSLQEIQAEVKAYRAEKRRAAGR